MTSKIMFYLKVSVCLIISPFLHQPFHLAHLALQEAVDADFAPVGVEGDYGKAGA